MRIVGYGDLVEVGRGGFGVIYRAHHQALDRIVAIKVLADTNLTQDQRQRFQREALAMAQLSWHPGIVTIYDTGITDTGQPYLAMEYLPNGSLGDQLRANGPLDPDTITHHGTQLADALQAAHDNGILHRDIKPDNVLVDPLGQPKLTDFGIAALADHTRSATNLLTGSVGHTAPELLEGQPATTASDIYALGSTLFELATGHPPFIRPDDDNLLAIALRTKTQPVPDLRPAGCPDTLATAIETAMAKDPHQRHPTPTDLANALTTAAPPPPPPPQPPTTRPRRRALIGATLVAIAATGTIAVAAITRTNNNPNATTAGTEQARTNTTESSSFVPTTIPRSVTTTSISPTADPAATTIPGPAPTDWPTGITSCADVEEQIMSMRDWTLDLVGGPYDNIRVLRNVPGWGTIAEARDQRTLERVVLETRDGGGVRELVGREVQMGYSSPGETAGDLGLSMAGVTCYEVIVGAGA